MIQGAIQLSDAAEHLIGSPCKDGKKQQTRLDGGAPSVRHRLHPSPPSTSSRGTYVEGKRQPAFSWNWQWAAAEALPGGSNPSGRPEHPLGMLAKPAGEAEAWPTVSPRAGSVSPRLVAPLFTAPATFGSPAAVEAPLGHTLPQLSFPVLVAPPCGGWPGGSADFPSGEPSKYRLRLI